jgi:DNA-binding protein HU-beta
MGKRKVKVMYKSTHELARTYAQKHGVTIKEAESRIKDVFDLVEDTLARGDSIKVPSHFTIEPVVRGEHTGHNPKTGESLVIPCKVSVRFKLGKGLSDRLNRK